MIPVLSRQTGRILGVSWPALSSRERLLPLDKILEHKVIAFFLSLPEIDRNNEMKGLLVA